MINHEVCNLMLGSDKFRGKKRKVRGMVKGMEKGSLVEAERDVENTASLPAHIGPNRQCNAVTIL